MACILAIQDFFGRATHLVLYHKLVLDIIRILDIVRDQHKQWLLQQPLLDLIQHRLQSCIFSFTQRHSHIKLEFLSRAHFILGWEVRNRLLWCLESYLPAKLVVRGERSC